MYGRAMELTSFETGTLRRLSERKRGRNSFVAILPAQSLTHLGLAARTREGWVITDAGEAWMAAQQAGPDGSPRDGVVLAFPAPARLH